MLWLRRGAQCQKRQQTLKHRLFYNRVPALSVIRAARQKKNGNLSDEAVKSDSATTMGLKKHASEGLRTSEYSHKNHIENHFQDNAHCCTATSGLIVRIYLMNIY